MPAKSAPARTSQRPRASAPSRRGGMPAITRTKSGTLVVDGVEYSTYPPPRAIVKAMQHQWANQLVIAGSMRFGSLEYYRKLENAVLGDPNDGEGLFHMNAHPFAVGSS